MRPSLCIVSFVLSALFLFSVLSPEPDYVQGYNTTAGFPTFVECDAACALCSDVTLAPDGHQRTERLALFGQARFTPSLIIAKQLCRAPPSRLSPTS